MRKKYNGSKVTMNATKIKIERNGEKIVKSGVTCPNQVFTVLR